MSAAVVDPVRAVTHMLAHPFMVRAFVAGGLIASASGFVGYFLVLRSQVFTADALSHVSLTGALAALAAGIDLRVGLFAACIAVAALIGLLGPRGRADDVVIGNVFAWTLGLGVLFLSIYTTSGSGGDGTAGVNILFGSIFGLSSSQARVAALVAVATGVVLIAIARPLLFASLDPAVARARGMPVRGLGVVFLCLVGVTAGEATQAVGALLLLGLLAAPAGAAQRLTDRPWVGLWLSSGIALASMWVGLSIAYAAPRIPPSFAILALAAASHLIAVAATARGRFRPRRAPAAPSFRPPPAGHG